MDEIMNPHLVYVRTDEQNCVIAVNSSAFLTDTDGWTQIDSGFGDKYHHAQGNYFQLPIMDERGIWRYKLEDGMPVERAVEEMDADYAEAAQEPTDKERIAALEERLAEYEEAYAKACK